MDAETPLLDKLLDPLTQAFTPEMAQIVADYRADEATQVRVDELAEKSSDGTLTDQEQQEYAAIVEAATVIAILQAKARKALQAA